MEELLRWHLDGKIEPYISDSFDLAEASKAMALLRDRRSLGKVVLTVAADD
jgi:NADPH2:quinone reductase